ncbi:MAG: DUF1830 domain-containing protein [Xenococcaceae cyanobacterium MO_188.B32]|nr:DUF1830 domain-containing protein [Xenococcaceae cyanobacterium MO_188.B32]
MSQILDPVPHDTQNSILCCYVNKTSQIQIARITNIANWYFERVVFPGQRLVFETFSQALLEIHSGMMATAILSDTIPCERLCLQESKSSAHDKVSLSDDSKTDSNYRVEAIDRDSKTDLIFWKTPVSV